MDVTPYLDDLKPAPRAVFDSLPERSSRVRFMLPTPDGDWSAVTWGRFARTIRGTAMFLRAVGLSPAARAAIYAPNSVEWAAAALGIQAAGGVMVPVYPGSTAEQAAYVIAHSGAEVLFVDTPALLGRIFRVWPRLRDLRAVVLLGDGVDALAVASDVAREGGAAPSPLDVARLVLPWSRAQALGAAADAREPGAFERALHGIDLDQPGLMLYTSGTTGNPKGVPLTHRNVGVNGRDWLECNHSLLDEDAVDLLWLPMSHIFGFGELCLGNTLGFTTYWADPHSVLTRLPEVRPSVFMSVPSYWEKLARGAWDEAAGRLDRDKLARLTGGRLEFCLSGGAGLKREVKEQFHACGILLIEGYGLTETSPTLTLNRPDDFDFETVGKPLPSVQLQLADDGEILAKGPTVFAGYHRDPEATKDAFTEDGWFKTGDIGRWTEKGFLQIIDRKKDILVTAGGKNVPPANIEVRFRDDPLIEHVVVYGDGKKYLVAGVWPSAPEAARLAGEGADRKERLAALVRERVERVNRELGSWEAIKKFRVFEEPLSVDNGMLTPSLKVKRKQVYERFGAQLEALYRESGAAVTASGAEAAS